MLQRKESEAIYLDIPPSTEARTVKLVFLEVARRSKHSLRVGIDAGLDIHITRDDAKYLAPRPTSERNR